VNSSMMKSSVFLLLLSLIFGLLSTPSYGMEEERLKAFLKGDDYWNVRLSPDGKHISLLTQQDDRNTLVVLDIETMQPTVSVKYEEDKKIEITSVEWIDNNLLRYTASLKVTRLEAQFATPDIFLLTVDGKRNERIWSFHGNFRNNSKGKGKLVRGFPSILSNLPEDKRRVLLYVRSFERRDGAGRGGIYKLELRSGDVREVSKVPEFTQSVLSAEDGNVLVASTVDRNSSKKHYFSLEYGDWLPLVLGLDGFAEEFVPFEVSGDYIFATAQASSPIDAPTHIVRYQISTGEWQDVFEVGFASLRDVAVDDNGKLLRVQWIDGKPEMSILDKDDAVSKVVSHFARNYEGFNVTVISETDDKKKILLHVGSGAYAGEYFLFDFETRRARFLVAMRADIDGSTLSSLEDASFESSDGVTIPGWFQAPKGADKPPLVVYVHGGPHGPYNSFSFNIRWHLLNEMGYAVYAPNFRGSGGYGPNFEYAGYREWGTRMLDDVYEGVQALIEQGRVDPDRVCIFGGSYGGYASAQSLVRFNDFYRCGVVIAGFFDATTQMDRSDTGGWYAGDKFMAAAIGEDLEHLRAMSPIFNIGKIRAPMLLLHGEEDERTPFKGAVEFVAALQKEGKAFDYHWYAKEGHGNAKLENQIDEWNRIEAFLKKNIGNE
jgi:dipeptidyl aminopeptidase/acylaminoacyl peptidase